MTLLEKMSWNLKEERLSFKIEFLLEFQKLLQLIEGIVEKMRIASGYVHLWYAADTSSNDAAWLTTRIDILEAEASNRPLFFDLWFKKKIIPNDAFRLINSYNSL